MLVPLAYFLSVVGEFPATCLALSPDSPMRAKITLSLSRSTRLAVTLFAMLPLAGKSKEVAALDLPAIDCDLHLAPPAWALYERQLIDALNEAGVIFHDTYVEEDGTVTFKERYESGMNSSDDFYEAFRGFSLHTALGGSHELDRRNRHVWEGITRQFTRYGQIYREFDSNWDWMHHGEGYINFYPMGMIEPQDSLFRDRAVRFAAMFIGEDPEAPNWDLELKQMRAVMNGSRGPLMEWSKRDWTPTNANLVYYPLPFRDIPGVDATTAWINDHPDNDQFALLVKGMSDRMAKGDVPLNLISSPLIASAYLYTGDEKYVQWATDYLTTWEKLTASNNGIIPDNVGLSGEIGEYTGHWWGGYYGWVWPSGTHIIRALLNGGKVTTLLSGDPRWMDLARSQLAVIRSQGIIEDGPTRDVEEMRQMNVSEKAIESARKGLPIVPVRHDDRGWYHFVEEDPFHYLHVWYMTQKEEDLHHLERLAEAEKQAHGRVTNADLEWTLFVKGRNPDFAERAFREDLQLVARKIDVIQNDRGDPETWVDNKWINHNPMITKNLERLSVGGLAIDTRGEMMYSQVRYFDGERRRSGLPADVSALVTRIEPDWIEVEVVNLSVTESRHLVIQGGAYGEHQFGKVEFTKVTEMKEPVENPSPRESRNRQSHSTYQQEVDGVAFSVHLTPGAGTSLRIQIDRYSNQPSYTFPWDR